MEETLLETFLLGSKKRWQIKVVKSLHLAASAQTMCQA